MPRFGTVPRDHKHPPAGMVVVAGGGSPARPLILPPQRTSPREGLLLHCRVLAALDECSGIVLAGLLHPLYFSPDFCFFFLFFLLSTVSENKDIQNK